MARDAFVGLKALYLAELTDEDELTYETPVDIGTKAGAVSIAASREISTDAAYANDDTWIEAETDSGGTGTLEIRDILTDSTVRETIAKLTGYLITTEGDLLATDKPSKPCALLCEQSGYIHGRRKCFYKIKMRKPDFEAKTKEGSTTIGSLSIPFSYYKVKLADGVVTSTRDSFYGNSTYNTFFDAVVKTYAEKGANPSTQH